MDYTGAQSAGRTDYLPAGASGTRSRVSGAAAAAIRSGSAEQIEAYIERHRTESQAVCDELLRTNPALFFDMERRIGADAAGARAVARNGMLYARQASEPRVMPTAQAGGHFYLPSLVAQAAGVSNARLLHIIAFSQFPDQVSALDAYTNGTRYYAAGAGYDPALAGLMSARSLHALNGRTVEENLVFYQSVIARHKDNDAVVGLALHGLVDTIFHSRMLANGEYRTYTAPLGHGAHGSGPDYISADQALAATGQIIAAFETITGRPLGDEQRNAILTQVNAALSRARDRTRRDVEQAQRYNNEPPAGPAIDAAERMELNFRDVVREMAPVPDVNINDLPSPFFRRPITPEGTAAEGRSFFGGVAPEQADALTRQGLEAAALIANEYRDTFGDRTVEAPMRPDSLFDSQVWSLRRLVPWLNVMPKPAKSGT